MIIALSQRMTCGFLLLPDSFFLPDSSPNGWDMKRISRGYQVIEAALSFISSLLFISSYLLFSIFFLLGGITSLSRISEELSGRLDHKTQRTLMKRSSLW
jgi:hypothetical protein